ncbi:KpsF/GutQ family sugar-phosphate isomerase [Methanocalculus sp.]|uniref:KpsF/GutQ family sugar-phosphate isomerase n=1 Tax=Methanocalculus sp. TaxID=2004547 RepID=UPI00262135A1|nr:KpsF/GutQ family sugar-phosphate isomerase [Methanocalculus sp.]MDG6250212.1 KpsF/GutQ family sugar-phosphate isomerase [Methanocalculus sp.]
MKNNRINEAKNIIQVEIDALLKMKENIDDNFVKAIDIILSNNGRVIVSGVGKSGLIGKKIASTLASTGTPSFFIHPTEGLHGDLGMVVENDVALLISNSGETQELLNIMPSLKRIGVPIIAFTGKRRSTLAMYSDVILDIGVEREAGELNLAPTSSTTTTLAMGDALALVLFEERGFKTEDYAIFHPGGSIGKKLLLKVDDVMHMGEINPIILQNHTMKDAIIEISQKGLGAVSVVDSSGRLVGIITDGDLRRGIETHKNILERFIHEIMTKNPICIESGRLAVEAVKLMEDRPKQISVLPVIDADEKPIGMLRIHDLVKSGVA